VNPGAADASPRYRQGEPAQDPASLPRLPDFTDVDLTGLCAGSGHPVLSEVARSLKPRAEEAYAATMVAFYEDGPMVT
jgi:hypothetical protein